MDPGRSFAAAYFGQMPPQPPFAPAPRPNQTLDPNSLDFHSLTLHDQPPPAVVEIFWDRDRKSAVVERERLRQQSPYFRDVLDRDYPVSPIPS